MTRDVNWTREADVQIVAAQKDAALSGLMLKETSGYQWSMAAPPDHWGSRGTLRTLKDLNAAFSGYTALLTDAASGELKDPEMFDGLAESLNRELRALKEALGGLTPADKTKAAGLSAFAGEALRNYVQARRARDLERALKDNQPLVADYSAQARSLLVLIRADLKTAYADQVQAIHEKWDDKRSPGRITLTRSLFNLNEEYADAMEALEALEVFYNGLPAAHEDLRKIVARTKEPRSALAELGRSAGRVARLTRELEKTR